MVWQVSTVPLVEQHVWGPHVTWDLDHDVLRFPIDLPTMSIHKRCLLREESTVKFYHLNIYLIAQNIYSSHTTRCLELLFIYSLLLSGCT